MDKELKDFLERKFNRIDQRFDKMDSRFDKMDSRFDKMDSRSDKMDSRFDKMDSRFDKMDRTLETIRTDVNVNKTNILVGFKEAKEERSTIERRINDTYDMVDGFAKNVDELQDEFTVTKEDSKRVKNVLREKLGVDMA